VKYVKAYASLKQKLSKLRLK